MAGGFLQKNETICTGCKKDHVVPKGVNVYHVRNRPGGKAVAHFCEAAFKKIPKRHQYNSQQHRDSRRMDMVAIYNFMATAPFCHVPRQVLARRLPRVEQCLLAER